MASTVPSANDARFGRATGAAPQKFAGTVLPMLFALAGLGIAIPALILALNNQPLVASGPAITLTPGVAITVTGTNQAPIVNGKLSQQARTLNESDAANPVCMYSMPYRTLAANEWDIIGFASSPIGNGQGQGADQWNIPFTGLYMVQVTCYSTLYFDSINNRVGLNLALSLRATTSDPFSGLIPAGGFTRSDVSYVNDTYPETPAPTGLPTDAPTTEAPSPPSPAAPTEAPTTMSPTARRRHKAPAASRGGPSYVTRVDHFTSLSASFRACNGCVQPTSGFVGDLLQLHVRVDVTDGARDSASMRCNVQTARIL